MKPNDRLEWLREEHTRLNRLIDDMEKHTVPDQEKIHNLKKKRLHFKDEIATIQKQLHEEQHERLDWDE